MQLSTASVSSRGLPKTVGTDIRTLKMVDILFIAFAGPHPLAFGDEHKLLLVVEIIFYMETFLARSRLFVLTATRGYMH